MDLQKVLTDTLTAGRNERLKTSPQMTLGEMIARLEPIVEMQAERVKEGKEEATVRFDFEYLHPTGISSWRGSYAELALEFDGDKEFTVTEFVDLLKSCVGKTFVGYKGGDFVMGKATPIWVANYGNSGNTGVVGIRDEGYYVALETTKCDF